MAKEDEQVETAEQILDRFVLHAGLDAQYSPAAAAAADWAPLLQQRFGMETLGFWVEGRHLLAVTVAHDYLQVLLSGLGLLVVASHPIPCCVLSGFR